MNSKKKSDLLKEKKKLRKRLGASYISYTRSKQALERGEGWFGDWQFQMQQMEEQVRDGYKSEVDEIMKKLGYKKWKDEDVIAELKILHDSKE